MHMEEGDTMAPRKRTAVPDTLTASQMRTLMDTLDARYTANVRMRAMLMLMYTTGIRVGEACALPETGVRRCTERYVTVPYVDGLTKRGGRRVGIPQSEALDAALDAWEAVRKDSPHYFHTNTGERVDTSQVRRRLSQLGRKAGLGRVHPHMLRHTYGRNLVAAGVPITVVQSALGHSDLATTMLYTRIGEAEQIAALDAVRLEV